MREIYLQVEKCAGDLDAIEAWFQKRLEESEYDEEIEHVAADKALLTALRCFGTQGPKIASLYEALAGKARFYYA